ncbi:MAG: hypothetical protein J7K65_07190 [Planctomycetes bacterium]|nr:hypothetical protein [Planctomycetota bacterium]
MKVGFQGGVARSSCAWPWGVVRAIKAFVEGVIGRLAPMVILCGRDARVPS